MLDLNVQTTHPAPLLLKHQSKRHSCDGLVRRPTPLRLLPDPVQLKQKQLSPSIDHFKSHISEFAPDFDNIHEVSIAPDIGVGKDIYILHTNRPSFYINKSSNTADTADTQLSMNQSASCLDIPSERSQLKMFTTYEGYQDLKHSVQKTEESLNILSFKTSRSLSTQTKSRAASRYKDCSPENKAREFAGSNTTRASYRFSHVAGRELQGFSRQENISEKSPLATPRLGTMLCSFVNLTETKENNPPVIQPCKTERVQKKTSVFSIENTTNPIEGMRMVRCDLIQEREALRIEINKLKKKIKEEESKKLESYANIQSLQAKIEKGSKKSECQEKKGHTLKNQLHTLKKEVMFLMQEIDEYNGDISGLKQRLDTENKLIERQKEHIKRLKHSVMAEAKERENIKAMVDKSNKSVIKASNAYGLLVLEKMKYKNAIEKNMVA